VDSLLITTQALLRLPVPQEEPIPALNTQQKKALNDSLGQMAVKDRKLVMRQASEQRQVAQKNSKKPVGSVEDFLYKLVCNEPIGEVGTVERVEATLCHVRTKMEVKPMQWSQENRPVVGDEVEIDLVKNRILKVLPRRTFLARHRKRLSRPKTDRAVLRGSRTDRDSRLKIAGPRKAALAGEPAGRRD